MIRRGRDRGAAAGAGRAAKRGRLGAADLDARASRPRVAFAPLVAIFLNVSSSSSSSSSSYPYGSNSEEGSILRSRAISAALVRRVPPPDADAEAIRAATGGRASLPGDGAHVTALGSGSTYFCTPEQIIACSR